MSEAQVPCGRYTRSEDRVWYLICTAARLCPHCTAFLDLRRRVAELEAAVATLKNDVDAAVDVMVDHDISVPEQFKTFGKLAEVQATAARRLELLRPFAEQLKGFESLHRRSGSAIQDDGALPIYVPAIRAAAAEVKGADRE